MADPSTAIDRVGRSTNAWPTDYIAIKEFYFIYSLFLSVWLYNLRGNSVLLEFLYKIVGFDLLFPKDF